MSSRYEVILANYAGKTRAVELIRRAPWNSRVEIKGPRRTHDQNSKLWAALTDISLQKSWHGQKLSPKDWKHLFLAALKQEVRIVPNLSGNGFVQLGRSSSDLSKEEFSDLLEIILAWGAENDVRFQDERAEEPA